MYHGLARGGKEFSHSLVAISEKTKLAASSKGRGKGKG